jgi:hypothetical protein
MSVIIRGLNYASASRTLLTHRVVCSLALASIGLARESPIANPTIAWLDERAVKFGAIDLGASLRLAAPLNSILLSFSLSPSLSLSLSLTLAADAVTVTGER